MTNPSDPDPSATVRTPPPLLSSLHAEIVESVVRQLDSRQPKVAAGVLSAPSLSFDLRAFIEKVSRDALDEVAKAIGPGAVAQITANREFYRRFLGDGVLHLAENLIRALMDAPRQVGASGQAGGA